MRIGLRYVRGLSDALLERIDATRDADGPFADLPFADLPFADLQDFSRRTAAPVDALEALATAGAFECFGIDRREALWGAGALSDARPGRRAGMVMDRLPGMVTGVEAPALPEMSPIEQTAADLWATGMSANRHPTEFARERLSARGAVTAADLRTLPHRTIVEVGGVVTHRQQPETAKGVVFLSLEDETGLVNVICTPDVWKRCKQVARTAPALCVRGLLERHQGVTNLIARRIEALDLSPASLSASFDLRSRDFR
jgi:error-prone DNA polymerase